MYVQPLTPLPFESRANLSQYIFPLLYLSLRYHLQLFYLAQEQPMCEYVFTVSVNSLLHVYEVFSRRYQQISSELAFYDGPALY